MEILDEKIIYVPQNNSGKILKIGSVIEKNGIEYVIADVHFQLNDGIISIVCMLTLPDSYLVTGKAYLPDLLNELQK